MNISRIFLSSNVQICKLKILHLILTHIESLLHLQGDEDKDLSACK